MDRTRTASARRIVEDSLGYVRDMSEADCDKLLLSLSRTHGLSEEEASEAKLPPGPDWLLELQRTDV